MKRQKAAETQVISEPLQQNLQLESANFMSAGSSQVPQ